jgi:hypothetical protein
MSEVPLYRRSLDVVIKASGELLASVGRVHKVYSVTSLSSNRTPPEPYSRSEPRSLLRSWDGGVFV